MQKRVQIQPASSWKQLRETKQSAHVAKGCMKYAIPIRSSSTIQANAINEISSSLADAVCRHHWETFKF